EPVLVTVTPLEAPMKQVFKTISITKAFGGYNLEAKNPTRDNIAVMVMRRNDLGEFEVDNFRSIFTRTDNIDSKIRGMDTLEQERAVFVRDNWGNSSDTLFTEIKPIY